MSRGYYSERFELAFIFFYFQFSFVRIENVQRCSRTSGIPNENIFYLAPGIKSILFVDG